MRHQKTLTIIVAIIVAFVYLAVSTTANTVYAHPPAQTATQSAKPYTTWDNTLSFVLKATKSFAWIRNSPSATAGSVFTLRPGVLVIAQAAQPDGEVWDGVQWWGYVLVNPQIQGWVEIDSLQSTQTTATTSAPATPTAESATATPPAMPYPNWDNTLAFVLKSAKPFGWLRKQPSSTGTVTYTVRRGVTMVGQALNSGAEVWDGVQWWGWVTVGSIATGWIEIDSLQTASAPTSASQTAVATTATPAPIPYQTWDGTLAFVLKPTKAFAWLRRQPSSTGSVLLTVQPGTIMIGVPNNGSGEFWDGVQWWGMVIVNGRTTGWVEIDSLQVTQLPTPTAVPTTATPSAMPYQTWDNTLAFVLKATKPFGWLRKQPSSTGAVIFTVQPGVTVVGQALDTGGEVWDGVQWWGWVRVNPSIVGWLEIDSLQAAPVPTPGTPTAVPTQPAEAKANWAAGQVLRVKANVPFAWLRASPAPEGTVIGTLGPNALVRVSGDPEFDGTQWWWLVQPPGTNTPVGWIEQKLLIG